MSNESLIAMVVALIAAHYLSIVWEIRKLRTDIDALRNEIHSATLAVANAALAAATLKIAGTDSGGGEA